MTPGRGERLFGWLLRLYPREFRERYAADLVAFFREDRKHPRYGSGPLRPIRFWAVTCGDLVRAAINQHKIARQQVSQGDRAGFFSRLRHDLRFAWRGLWASPGVTLAAAGVLTLGIGAATAIFSVVDGVVLRGLPFPENGRIVSIVEKTLATGRLSTVSPQNYADWRARQDVFESIGAFNGAPLLTTREEPVEMLRQVYVSASLFDVLRVRPSLGRPFGPDDERHGSDLVAIISDRLWRHRFGSDPAILSRRLASPEGPLQIVGVMPPDFSYPLPVAPIGPVEIWRPYVPTLEMTVRGRTRLYTLSVVARLKPGVTLERAAQRMTQIREGIAAEYPAWEKGQGVVVRRLRDAIVGASVRSWMLLLLGAVGVVLLMACLNAANLLVARAAGRAPELAVRAALGASRRDLARSLVVESLLLSLIGAAGGVLAATWGIDVLRAALPTSVPRLATVALDLRVLSVAVLASIVSGLMFGTIPALQASRPDLVTLLGQGGRSHSGGRAGRRLRSGLIVAEITLAMVLLAGAGLFFASFVRVTTIPLGFDPQNVTVFLGGVMDSSLLVPAKTAEGRAGARSGQSLVADACDRIRSVPGVVSVAPMQGGRPLEGSWITVPLQRAGHGAGTSALAMGSDATPPDQDEPVVRAVGPDYLDVLRGTLLRGRWISPKDVDGATPVVVLSDEAVRHFFGSDDPLGQHVLMDGYDRMVVGVVAAMRWRGPESDIAPEAFVPFFQTSHPTAQLLVRTDGDSALLMPAIESAIHAEYPATLFTGIYAPESLERSYAGLISQRRFNMIILSTFGLAGIAIAAVGIYGLMAFLVEQRRREIGVRVALGAERSNILSLVLVRAMGLMIAGLVPGLAAALLLEKTARSFLFDARPHDPALYAIVATVLFVTGLAAALGPARRAMRMDPLQALRLE